jgi:hypothetical protein
LIGKLFLMAISNKKYNIVKPLQTWPALFGATRVGKRATVGCTTWRN